MSKNEINKAKKNTDKEIWRSDSHDYYSSSIHVTESGSIGINVGGNVIVASIEKWHEGLKNKKFQDLDSLIDRILDRVRERNKETIKQLFDTENNAKKS